VIASRSAASASFGSRAETELEPAPAQLIERRRLLGQHRRRAEGQIGHVGEDANALRLAEEIADQRHRIEVLLLIGVILDADQVVAEVVEDVRNLDGALGVAGRGIEEETELQVVAVVGHRAPPVGVGKSVSREVGETDITIAKGRSGPLGMVPVQPRR
jgi:hypothetical protein